MPLFVQAYYVFHLANGRGDSLCPPCRRPQRFTPTCLEMPRHPIPPLAPLEEFFFPDFPSHLKSLVLSFVEQVRLRFIVNKLMKKSLLDSSDNSDFFRAPYQMMEDFVCELISSLRGRSSVIHVSSLPSISDSVPFRFSPLSLLNVKFTAAHYSPFPGAFFRTVSDSGTPEQK